MGPAIPAAVEGEAIGTERFVGVEGEEARALIAKVEFEGDGLVGIPDRLGGSESALEAFDLGAPRRCGLCGGLGADKRGLDILSAAGGEQCEQGEGQSSGVWQRFHQHPFGGRLGRVGTR